MGSFNRDDRGGSRGGYQSRGRSSFGGNRGGYQSRGRSSFGGGRDSFGGGDRQMFKAVCDNCGKDCEVPFRPTSGKPVYCSDCFEKMGGRNSESRPERSDFRPRERASENNAQLDNVIAKLDRILTLLEAKNPKTVTVPAVVEEVKEKKAPKVKKEKEAVTPEK